MTRFIFIVLCILIGEPAWADAVCGPRADIAAALAEVGEQVVSQGLETRGAMIEVFASPEGSWTIVLTGPSGMSCMMAAGQAWEAVNLSPKGQGT